MILNYIREMQPARGFVHDWCRSVDYTILTAIILLYLTSLVVISSAGNVIEHRITLPNNHFLYKQVLNILISFVAMLVVSSMPNKLILFMSISSFASMILLMIIMPFISYPINGARRWISLLGMYTLQPSEIIKPFFAVCTAQVLSCKSRNKYFLSAILYVSMLILIAIQPDFGMSILVSIIWLAEIFIAGVPYRLLVPTCTTLIIITVLVCSTVPYVKSRIYSHFDPAHHDNFQVKKSMEALRNGGLTGVGPGEGTVKFILPDCHTDFIFAVIGEEFGCIFSLLILCTFAFITFKSFVLAYKTDNMFYLLAISGLTAAFTAQFLINIGVATRILPTTGLALPLLSYGGSSAVASGVTLGIILNFGKKRKIVPLLSGSQNYMLNFVDKKLTNQPIKDLIKQ